MVPEARNRCLQWKKGGNMRKRSKKGGGDRWNGVGGEGVNPENLQSNQVYFCSEGNPRQKKDIRRRV